MQFKINLNCQLHCPTRSILGLGVANVVQVLSLILNIVETRPHIKLKIVQLDGNEGNLRINK